MGCRWGVCHLDSRTKHSHFSLAQLYYMRACQGGRPSHGRSNPSVNVTLTQNQLRQSDDDIFGGMNWISAPVCELYQLYINPDINT